ncbi:BNR-4 repeat-containing protein [Catenovulum agarivorans]|uniref:BNR-4 repeat-containing protein n=1 Tax=Catenovulum agarivorans TaxID=1172192 RepID=UPI0002DA4C55|nr:BNR-4 repeat-containing protein [Catenovulum agarivorans]
MNRYLKCSALTLSAALAALASSNQSLAAVSLIEEAQITDQGLYFWYPNDAKAYHYAANISPRGDCLTVVNGFAYFGWFKGGMNNRKLMLSRKRIGSGEWVSVEFPHKNTFIENTNWGDSHRTIALSVSEKDGTIHILFDHHNDPLNYIVSKKNLAFASDELFSKLTNFHNKREYLAEGQNVRITYPTLVENADGDIVVHYRKGSAVGGNEMVHVYNGESWTRAKQVTRGSGLPYVAVEDRNYAYGKAAFGNGDVYYTWSVRWAAKKADGILNEGVYLAKTGPTMTDEWEDLNGVKHPLPIQDYSPFLIDVPATPGGTGSSSGPGISVSDDGGIHLTYRGRTSNTDYHYTYSRKAGEQSFTKHVGKTLEGLPYEDKLYRAIASSSGLITISSTVVGSIDDKPEFTLQTPYKFGNSIARIDNGRLVLIAEDRTVQTDSQNLFSYIFDLTDGEPLPPIGPIGPVDPTPIEPPEQSNQAPVVTFPQEHMDLVVGYQNLYLDIAASASVSGATITQVELYINDNFIRKEGVAPYEWGHGGRTELLGLAKGSHIFKAVTTDSDGRIGEAIMTVNVHDEADLKPLVSFPSSAMTVTEGYSELVLDINASSPFNYSAIANVKLFINGTLVRQESVAPYEWGHAKSPNPQETTGLPVGQHTFSAVATDQAGEQTTASMLLTVTAKPLLGDLDNDGDVDRNDVRAFSLAVRTDSITDLAYDFNNDGVVNSYDVRGVALLCTRSACAVE